MIAVGAIALVCGIVLLILLAGYCYGRAETEAHYAPLIGELEETIDALLPSHVKVLP